MDLFIKMVVLGILWVIMLEINFNQPFGNKIFNKIE